MVLLIVDTQKAIMNDSLYRYKEFVANVQSLIAKARANGTEVIFVRHDDGEGQPLTKGADGFEISEYFAPADGERIFDKSVNSPFKQSGLLEYLREKRENDIMVAGLQTDYCIDATVKCGFEHGFKVYVPAYCNTTFDSEYMTAEQTYRYHNDHMWKNRYALCLSADDALKLL